MSLSSNYVICLVITHLGVQGELLLAIDLAARTIVGHCYSPTRVTPQQVCETIEVIARQRSFLPKIEIIHSDCGALFLHPQIKECLSNLNILESKGFYFLQSKKDLLVKTKIKLLKHLIVRLKES